MPLSDQIERASVSAPAPGHHLSLELAETIKLAAPMAATQLGQIAMMTTDLAFIGRLGDAAVAAAALAGTIYFVAFTVGMGLMSAVAPLGAQAFPSVLLLACGSAFVGLLIQGWRTGALSATSRELRGSTSA